MLFRDSAQRWRRLLAAARGGEQTSDQPHVHGEQGELLRQEEDLSLQAGQEARVVRAHRHPVGYLATPEQRLHNPQEVEGILILDQRELLEGGRALPFLENRKQLWVLWFFSSVMTSVKKMNKRADGEV